MRRFITILIIILIVAAIILGGAWFFSRRTAVKNGAPAPTFRQFLSGQTNTPGSGTETPGTDTSVFVDNTIPGTPTTTPSEGTPGPETPGVNTSTFTNTTVTPPITGPTSGSSSSGGGTISGGGTPIGGGGANGGGTVSGGGTVIGGSGSGTTTPSTTPGTTPSQDGPTVTLPTCSAADTTITFTAAELARLQALQRRFDALVPLLHGQSELTVEVSNYDEFKLKEQQVVELLNYCQSKEPLLTNPLHKIHVATPFWREIGRDIPGLGGYIGGAGNFMGPIGDITFAKRGLEHALRLNLW